MPGFLIFIFWVAFCPFAGRKLPKNRLFGVALPLHSFAALWNSSSPPLLSLPHLKLETEPFIKIALISAKC